MTIRLRINHESRYTYQRPVSASYNELRLTPLATPWQVPLETVMHIGLSNWQHKYIDYWGTQVCAFEIQRGHDELAVEVRSLVEIDATQQPHASPVTWDELAAPAVSDQWAELLALTPMTNPPAELAEQAEQLAASLAPYDAAVALSSFVHDAMSYIPGSTEVHTLAQEAWTKRSGVCQDYAHLLIGALRHIGVPARYVSGYLHPKRDAVVGETVVGESHAWVEWWAGDWVGYDPTNNIAQSDRHVIVGRGRDYADVPPIKGIVAGSAMADLTVKVELTRLM